MGTHTGREAIAKAHYGRKNGTLQPATWWLSPPEIGNGRHLTGREFRKYKKFYEEREKQERLRQRGRS